MTAPEAKVEYRIEREGVRFVAIDSEDETVGVYDSEEEAQAEIAREKKRGCHVGQNQGADAQRGPHDHGGILGRHGTALNQVNSAAGMTILGMEEEAEEPDR
jgi:hypothetical protein